MARFTVTVEYDVNLSDFTQERIEENLDAVMISPNSDSQQYNLTKVIEFLENEIEDELMDEDLKLEIKEDINLLSKLKEELVDYIEICY